MKRGPLEIAHNPFQKAVAQTPQLGTNSYRSGLRAIASSHRERIIARQSTILGSVNLDSALKEVCPEQPRWDYGIGVQGDSQPVAVWVEFHPAETNRVDEVIRKLRWLKEWLRQHAPSLNGLTPTERAFHWVATSGCHIQRSTPQARRLFQEGLGLPRQVLNIDQLEL